jgi:hypothetical protein
MRLSCRKAGYLFQILLRQVNLIHGPDRHSQNGWFHDEGETDTIESSSYWTLPINENRRKFADRAI